MKLGLALREVHRSELRLARALDAIAARHHSDHGIHHVALDLAVWSREHVALTAEIADQYGVRLRAHPRTAAATRQVQRWMSDRAGGRPEPSLLLLADLRRLHRLAAGVSLDWELLAQGAQAAKDDGLLALTNRCHPQALRQMRWANAMLKELSPQALAT
ncbi:hypothetical protein BST36_06580 [Mycolicibacterium moriokaense]|uniref:Uncharacterized protein n=1 Tax=Mycolicibacterium moriokaense TaxID=39691 RepID=A0AAD1HA46_9MYCO|nr:hypothetical protein [Mycolicibacterium moriokaense]MCV7039850.1 hypothetical protein [Mycolicibacterium moriokaense]ORB25696.1 hypothetical protein BST36_06580 [Mycolicibacterium moriokaense]BBX01702.1 hypothetical protein MMOR_26380 [Mycolicibacterium moriokaense]